MADVDDQTDEIESVAIIGLAGRFPGADSIHEFWQNLCNGTESITFFSNEELVAAGADARLLDVASFDSPNYVKARPILRDVDQFDAAFFGIPPREAEIIDPQQRLFLECAWQALEDAACDPKAYPGWIGVFGGVSANSYFRNNLWSNRDLLGSVGSALSVVTANDHDYLTTRVSYKLDLKGPSFDVQCACSTSLVATHLACLSLLSYHCDMALAGGVSISIPQESGYRYDEGSLVSPDGHCRPFDAQARGTVFGNGVGVVVLKRLSEALEDGDHIYAVIKGTAVTNDGSDKIGFTAPGVDGQKRVFDMALQAAGVDSESIGYIEAHGTGTSLGDPIEIEALTQVLRAYTDKKQFCAVGSVKGNIGHLDSAAGVTGLIKTSLSLKHGMLLPSINYESPNPKIDFANSPFYVSTELCKWKKTDGQPRRAGISSFGVGGTNAHAILEEAPEVEPSGPSRRCQLLVLSARSETALDRMTENLAAHLQSSPELCLADVAYTLAVGRQAFEKRRTILCETSDDARLALQEQDPKRVLTGVQVKPDRPVVFMFSGQGAQHVDMGRALYQHEPLFRDQVDACAEKLHDHMKIDLREVLYPSTADAADATQKLTQTRLAQPALFTIEYALAQLWMSWGVQPAAMIGHSIGEYTAACLAGVFSLEDALALVAARGELMQSVPPGAMLSIPLAEADVQPLLSEVLALAAVNGPSRCVVAGPIEAVATLEQQLVAEGVSARRLHTSHAFHSEMMDPILRPFEEVLRKLQLKAPRIPFISNTSGTWITAEEATDPAYWARHLRRPVRFSDGVSLLAESPEQALLEVGPGLMLRTLAQRHPDRVPEQAVFSSMRHPDDAEDDDMFLLRTLGQLWLTGVPVQWRAYYKGERRLAVSLPTYAFDRQRYWVEARDEGPGSSRPAPLIKAPDVTDWFYIPSWRRTLPPVQGPPEPDCHWLVLSSGDSFSNGLAEQMRARGYGVTTVLAGERYTADGSTFTVDPARPEDYRALLSALRNDGLTPSRIVHLWNMGSLSEDAPDLTDRALERGFYSLLYLAQAVAAQDHIDGVQLAVVSSNMQQVISGETVHPEKAALLGPCKVIRQEMQGITPRSIDVELPAAGSGQESQAVQQIMAELETDSADSIIAYRGHDRLVQTYEPVALPGVEGSAGHELREEGVYLITGGLGGIGLTLAKHLAEAARARLVLISRARFPAPEARKGWLATHDSQDRTSVRIKAVQDLEESGAEVLVVQADVSDLTQMKAAVRAACERFGTIHGVIHAAGLPGGGVIQLKTEEAASEVLRPKVHGTRVLEAVLKDMPLDFLALCSSVASTTGGVGQVDYCAANAFMDAFAHASNGVDGRMTVSINWDAWAQVGMAVNTAPRYSTSGQKQAVKTTPVDHPMLLRAARESDQRTVYQMELSPDKDWVLSEHLLMDTPTVPGTTYLELARAAYEDRTRSGQLEIHDVMFFTPLMVGRGDQKEAQLVVESEKDGFVFRAMSKAGVSVSGEPIWQMHASGQLRPIPDSAAPQQWDLEALRARCSSEETQITESVWDSFSSSGGVLKYGPRWHSPRRYSYGEPGEVLVSLELGEEFLPDLEGFKLHPALVDVATGFSMVVAADKVEYPYLPLSYKRVRIYDAFPARSYGYLRLSPDSEIGAETITFDVTVIDEQGRTAVDIKEFTLMRVQETAASRLRGSVASEPEPVADVQDLSDVGNAMLPEEGVDAFRRILARFRLPQVAVVTRHLPTLVQQAGEAMQERVLEYAAQADTRLTKHSRPNLQSPYVAPRNAVESKIAAIWSSLLGVDEVGVHDNFIELGGDSVTAVQVAAKVREAGFRAEPRQLMENQTVAELAKVLEPTSFSEGEELLPLTPYQERLLEQEALKPKVVVLEVAHRLEPEILEQAVGLVCAHHDALRMRFVQEGDGWRQKVEPEPSAGDLAEVDLSAVPSSEHDEAVDAEIARLRRGFDVEEPPLMRVTYLQMGTNGSDRMLLAVSPLSVDAAAIPILLDDISTAYRQLAEAADPELPQPTGTFAAWMTRVAGYAQSDNLQAEHEHWRQLASKKILPLPVDVRRDETAALPTRALKTRLTAEQTRQLEARAQAYRAHPEEIVLSALAQVLVQWTGQSSLRVGLTHHHRGSETADPEMSRIVACLRADFPLDLDLPTTDEPGAMIRAVKEQLRQVPQHGLGYGLLRSRDTELAAELPVTFSYQPPLPDYPLFRVAEVSIVDTNVDGQINVWAGAINGQLLLEWYYDPKLLRRSTVDQLSGSLIAALKELAGRAPESEDLRFSPSDFPAAGLKQDALDKFISRLSDKERKT